MNGSSKNVATLANLLCFKLPFPQSANLVSALVVFALFYLRRLLVVVTPSSSSTTVVVPLVTTTTTASVYRLANGLLALIVSRFQLLLLKTAIID